MAGMYLANLQELKRWNRKCVVNFSLPLTETVSEDSWRNLLIPRQFFLEFYAENVYICKVYDQTKLFWRIFRLDHFAEARGQIKKRNLIVSTFGLYAESKGSLTRDFLLQVFPMNQCPPRAYEYSHEAISIFFGNSRRYSRMTVYHRCQPRRWPPHQWTIIAGDNDTGNKFVHGDNVAGD